MLESAERRKSHQPLTTTGRPFIGDQQVVVVVGSKIELSLREFGDVSPRKLLRRVTMELSVFWIPALWALDKLLAPITHTTQFRGEKISMWMT